MKTDFRIYHPIVNLIYCVLVLGFSMFFMNPVFIVISFIISFFCASHFKGAENVKKYLGKIYIIALIIAFLNPLFNHRGVSVLAYLPTGNPLTLESLVFGLFSGILVPAVIIWFYAFNEIMPTDKIIYIFGSIFPVLSLVFSMTVSFVQLMKKRIAEINNSQINFFPNSEKDKKIKIKKAFTVFRVLMNRSLEEAVETSISMKARGYGLKGRTAFSIYNFEKKDKRAVIILLVLALIVAVGLAKGSMTFVYFDRMVMDFSLYGIACCFCFGLICMFPFLIKR